MGIYIQVENTHTGHSKRFGPYESVHPDLMIDEGNGWTWGPVQRILDSVDIIDDAGEPYSYIENVRVEGEAPTYWHNCYIVAESEGMTLRNDGDSVFGQQNDPYTTNPTMLRIYREHNGDWTLDGINELGQYTEQTWSYESLDDLKLHIFEFIEQVATNLKDPETPLTTKYLPIVSVDHDPETGEVLSVEVDWSDSQQAVEQLQEDGTELDEGAAENLGMFFDKWLENQPQAAPPRGHWYWEVSDG